MIRNFSLDETLIGIAQFNNTMCYGALIGLRWTKSSKQSFCLFEHHHLTGCVTLLYL